MNNYYPKLFILILFSALGCTQDRTSPTIKLRAEEYEVFSAFIKSIEPKRLDPLASQRGDTLRFINESTVFPRTMTASAYNTTTTWFYHADLFDSVAMAQEKLELERTRNDPRYPVFDYYRQQFPLYDWSYIKHDFDSVNANTIILDSGYIRASLPVRLLSYQDYRRWFLSRPPPSFSCLTSFSRVGFDAGKNIAILFCDSGVPGGGAFGYALFKRDGTNWLLVMVTNEGYL